MDGGHAVPVVGARLPSDPLRVLWVTTTAQSDGPGRALAALLRHWPRTDALALCSLTSIAPEFLAAAPPDLETLELHARGVWDVSVAHRLRRFCQRWRPDLMHTQLSRADWIGRPVARSLGLPVVSTIQNVHSRMYRAEFARPAANLGRVLDRLTAPCVSRFVAVSNGVKQDLVASKVSACRIVVIHNPIANAGVDVSIDRDVVRASWGAAAGDIVVGTVALLKPQKGIRDLVEAAALALGRDPRLQFVQMGSGPLAEETARRIEALQVGSRVKMLGQVAEPRALLPALDLFVLPSRWEGLPLALLEAMDAGLPCIGTSVSGIQDVITDDVTGVLVPAGNPQALAGAVISLAADPARRARIGAAARLRVRAFSAPAIAASHRRLYLELLA